MIDDYIKLIHEYGCIGFKIWLHPGYEYGCASGYEYDCIGLRIWLRKLTEHIRKLIETYP